MKEAIRLAIEGGFIPKNPKAGKFNWNNHSVTVEYLTDWRHCVVDPLFWQALGKAIRWDKTVCLHCGGIITYGEDTKSLNIKCTHKDVKDYEKKWLNCWHSFIDHLAEGKDRDSFFKDLIK